MKISEWMKSLKVGNWVDVKCLDDKWRMASIANIINDCLTVNYDGHVPNVNDPKV